MLSDEEMADVPWHDPELAFVTLERKSRTKLDKVRANAGNDSIDDEILVYINEVITFGHHLSISALSNWQPYGSKTGPIGILYRDFVREVDYYTAQVRMGRLANDENSVALDGVTKTKIHHHITRIRQQIENSDLPVEKKTVCLAN